MKKKNTINTIVATGLAVTIFGAVIWAVLTLLSKPSAGTLRQINVVASTNVWGSIAQEIGGKDVQVTSILSDPSTDPHLFETNADTVSKVSSAQLVITNGLGYDAFMDPITDFAAKSHRKLVVAQVYGADWGNNPHIWYRLPRINDVATAIQNELITLDPTHADTYRANTQAFKLSFKPAMQKLKQIKLLHAGTGVAYTERVPEYLLSDAGLINKTPTGFAAAVESGSEPSPQQVQEFKELLKSGQVKVLFYNQQSVNSVTQQIKDSAQAAGVKVVAVTETVPPGMTFVSWQLSQLNAIMEAL